MKILKTTLGVIGCLLAFAVLPVKADSISFDLSTGNSAISTYTGPYANVDVSLAGGIATITFKSLNNGSEYFRMGDGGSVAVNVNGTVNLVNNSIQWSSLAGTGFNPGGIGTPPPGPGQEDGFGNFNLTINTFDGFGHSADEITFELSGTWASAADVLTANAGGSTAAAHIYVSSDDKASTSALSTGFAGNGNVPDGGTTVALLGFALVGIGALRRKISRN